MQHTSPGDGMTPPDRIAPAKPRGNGLSQHRYPTHADRLLPTGPWWTSQEALQHNIDLLTPRVGRNDNIPAGYGNDLPFRWDPRRDRECKCKAAA